MKERVRVEALATVISLSYTVDFYNSSVFSYSDFQRQINPSAHQISLIVVTAIEKAVDEKC